MANKIFGIRLDVYNEKFEAIEIEDTLDELYRVCNCTCIDIGVRKIGRKYFTIICDEEGLCKEANFKNVYRPLSERISDADTM